MDLRSATRMNRSTLRLRHSDKATLLAGFVVALLLSVLVSGVAQAKNWERLDGCQLVPMSFNDGDSFLVKHGKREIVVRLYFVDCAETANLFPERVAEQAEYFGVSRARAIDLGKFATTYVSGLLDKRDGFTLFTKWQDGRGQKKRILAIIEINGKTLAETLAEQGLVRIHGYQTEDPWPKGMTPETMGRRLRSAEHRAKMAQRGGWGKAESIAVDMEGVSPERSEPRDDDAVKTIVERINLNLAAAKALKSLPNIGDVLAGRIIDGRPWRDVADLRHVEGIGAKTLQQLEPLVTVINLAAPRGTADYLRLAGDRYRNRKVRVSIAAVEEITLPAPDGFDVMRAHTGGVDEVGGAIAIFFPASQRQRVIDFYSQPRTGQTEAIFFHYQGEDVLVVPRRSTDVDVDSDEISGEK